MNGVAARHTPVTPAVGFVTPPRWISPSILEFPAVIDGPVVPQQAVPTLYEFDYSLGSVAAAHPAVCEAARMLGEAGCSVVAMEGTPFAWAGVENERAARARVDDLADAAGVPATMAGTSIIDALRALGAERVALCPTYYPADWRDAWHGFVTACGFEVAYCRTMADEGIAGPIVDNDTYGWDMGPERIGASVARATAAAPDAEAVVVTGAGCRTTPIIDELEAAAARPVVGADSALFWAAASAAGLPLRPGALGALTDATA